MKTTKQERKLTSNTNYIEWLIQFLQDKNYFVDKDLLLKTYKKTGIDYDNALIIGDFYNEIEEYAWKPNIYPKSNGTTSWYGIIYNGFRITINRGLDDCYLKSGLMHSCWKVKEDELDNDTFFIRFDDILENKAPESLEEYHILLQKISNYLLHQRTRTEIPFRQLLGTIYKTTEQMINAYDGPKKVKKLTQETKS